MTASRRLRVLHVLNQLRASGAEVMLQNSAAEWNSSDVEVHILAVAETLGDFGPELQAVGYPVHLEYDRPMWSVPGRLRRRVKSGRYDVVHLHAERGNFWFAIGCRLAGAKVVRTVHSVFGFHGWLRFERTVQRAVLRVLGVRHVAVGASVARNERSSFNNSTDLIENWYDDLSFRPPTPAQRDSARAGLGLAASDFVLVSVGNCSVGKRHESILAALAEADRTHRFTYVHVGAEEHGSPERIQAERLGVADRVQFLGRIHPLTTLHSADVFVMPSEYEGLGIAALEALATGLPSVLAEAPGLRDLAWLESVTLTNVEPKVLLHAISQVAEQSVEERMAAGKVSAAAVRNRFGKERGVCAYVRLYRNFFPDEVQL
jgi:glycosyltransferase involved in cell wall biosynthesis